ncbi:MAG: FliH/SctL family protein [Desulfurella sp.]|uniref:FliH/SctL family protein n=1 Tax=Desulfurella sp. TaxID=1962857 RepID=UPI003C9B9350
MKRLLIEDFALEEFSENEIPKKTQSEQETVRTPQEPSPNIDEIYQKAFSDGYEKGKTENTQNYEQQLLSLKSQYETIISNSKMELEKSIQAIDININVLKERINNIENEIINIAIEIAQKIIEKEIQNPDTIKNLIKKSLSLTKFDKIKLKLNAQQAKLIEKEFENIEIIADPGAAIGTIIIEEDSNIIDASINTKLEELKRSLINES